MLAGADFGPAERAPDIVFLHANGFNALTYRAILSAIAPPLRAIAIDQRGHGASTLTADPRGRRDWRDLVLDLLAYLGHLDAPPVIVAGHSMGGTVALLAAARAPEAVRSLVLFDPVIPLAPGVDPDAPIAVAARRRRAVFPSRGAALEAYRGRGAFGGWPEPILADYVAAGFRDLPSGEVTLACSPGWEASNYAAQDHDVAGAIASLSRLACILRADVGSTCSIAAPIPPWIGVEVVPGATHFFPMLQPDLAASALEQAATALNRA
ncbi:MAG: alpha/beta hydrolase [Caulobacteraceae bacterium]|nr:alpha/beta hydrolase [Caulobacteraceae bacterium]